MAPRRGYDVRKTLLSVTGLLVLLVILILVNVLFSFARVRWDLTDDKIYTLSEGTQRILSRVHEPITVKFFFSGSNRDLSTPIKLYAKRVREFLAEYEHQSRGLIRMEEYDPRPDSDEEELAQRYGLQPIAGPAGEKIYLGLSFLCKDREDRIEFLDPSKEELLEYDITRIIQRLHSSKQKVIGILSTLPVFGGPQPASMRGAMARGQTWLFVTELRKTYEVREIPPTTDSIDPSIDLMMVIHPKNLPLETQYAIDQYVLSGRRAMVFVDPLCVVDSAAEQQRGAPPPSSSLEKLFGAWGIAMDPAKAVSDMDQATRVRMGGDAVEDNPFWISAKGKVFNRSHVVTSRLESMLFPVVGAITKAPDASSKVESFVQSSPQSALVDAFKAGFGTKAIRQDFVSSGHPFDLAVMVRGKFKTAFPSGPPKGKDKELEAAQKAPRSKHILESNEETSLMVVADADLLADDFYVQRSRLLGLGMSRVFNDNLNFVANVCEILSGSDDLIGLRSRGRYERPFTAVQDLQSKAQTRWLTKEQELLRRADDANRKLRDLEQQKDASQKLILSPEQKTEIARFKEERQRINQELKEVRKNLRSDIESLGTTLKVVNILLMALCVSLAGIVFAILKQKRTRKQ